MKNKEKHYFDGIVTLVLFVVFAAGIISVIFAGAGAYSRLTKRNDAIQNERTAERYITTKVRSARGADSISVIQIGGSDALRISEEIEGTEYATYVWCSGGWIRETFTDAFATVNENSGEKLLKADAVSFSLENNLLAASVTIDGHEAYVYLNTCGGGNEK